MFLLPGLGFLLNWNKNKQINELEINQQNSDILKTSIKKLYIDQSDYLYSRISDYESDANNTNVIYFEARTEGAINININNAQNLKYFDIQKLNLSVLNESCNQITENIINSIKTFI